MKNIDITEGADYARKGPGALTPDRVRVVRKSINARRVFVARVYADGEVGCETTVPVSQILKPWADYEGGGRDA